MKKNKAGFYKLWRRLFGRKTVNELVYRVAKEFYEKGMEDRAGEKD